MGVLHNDLVRKQDSYNEALDGSVPNSGQVRVQKLAKWANDFWSNGGIGKIFCIFVVAIKAIQYGKSI